MTAREDTTAKMTALAQRQPVPLLAAALEQLDAKPKLDEAERLARAVLIEVICERCPAAEAAFAAWAVSDDNVINPVAAIVAAARKEGK